MNEKLNTETRTTAGESAFSNGIVERHVNVLFETFSETLEDVICGPEIALTWTVNAKNALQNSDGFNPNQLFFGKNVNTSSTLTDDLSALEPTTFEI